MFTLQITKRDPICEQQNQMETIKNSVNTETISRSFVSTLWVDKINFTFF